MLPLVLDVPHHRIQVSAPKGQDAIAGLPPYCTWQTQAVVREMGAAPLYLTYELAKADCGVKPRTRRSWDCGRDRS